MLQALSWICVPTGVADGRARCCLVACPRLVPDGEAGRLGDFAFADWPALLSSASFALSCGAQRVAATTSTTAELAIWQALFPADLLVRPGNRDSVSAVFGSYPAARVHSEVQALYAEATPLDRDERERALRARVARLRAARPTFLPGSRDDLIGRLLASRATRGAGAAMDLDATVQQLAALALDSQRRARITGERPTFIPIVPDDGSIDSALAQFTLFHRQSALGQAVTAEMEMTAAPVPTLDFHQRLTLLREYPKLLRRLGLIVDVECDFAALGFAAGSSAFEIAADVSFSNPGVFAEVAQPRTVCLVQAPAVFAAATRSDALLDGFLNLHRRDPDAVFSLVDFDLDGAGLQLIELLTEGATSDFACLRSTGPTMLRARQALSVFEAATAPIGDDENGLPHRLAAEDLVRGWRVDVRELPAVGWRSLHQRRGKYRIDGIADVPEIEDEDEGCIGPALSQPKRSGAATAHAACDPDQPNFIAEAMFLWDGWSLSAPRPGGVMPNDGPATAAAPAANLPLHVDFTALPGSLPRLRFGRSYQFRVRSSDLAGGGPGPDVTGEAPVALPEDGAGWTFRRFEAVASPVIERMGERAEHEPIDALVLRPELPAGDTLARCRITPPLVSQAMAEWAGMFDEANAERRFADSLAMARGAPPGPDFRRHARRGDDGIGLPDPFAAGIVLRNCPGVAPGHLTRVEAAGLVSTPLPRLAAGVRSLLTIDFAAAPAWPRVDGLGLELAAGEGPPRWDAASRTLTVLLPPAGSADIGIGCLPHADTLERMALLHWAGATLEGAARAEQQRLAGLGMMDMLTPVRPLRLVHAVQRPRTPPAIVSMEPPARPWGATAAFIGLRGSFDAASTARLELHASITDLLDHGSGPPPAPMEHDEEVLALVTDADPSSLPPQATLDLGSVVLHVLPLVALGTELRRDVQRVREAARKLHETAFAVRPVSQPLRDAAQAVQARAEPLFQVADREPFHLHWTALTTEAEDVAQTAAVLFLDPVDDEDLPPHAPPPPQPDFRVVAAALGLQKAALDLAERARRSSVVLAQPHPNHDFGDPKHRRVHYRLEAVSRFADFYRTAPSAVGQNAFAALSEAIAVAVPSAAPPAAPQVESIGLTFRWTRSGEADGSTRIERRCALRVHLARPWFSSGEGELLGVVLGIEGLPGSTTRFGTFSRLARDPIRHSLALPPDLGVASFRNPATVMNELQVPDGSGNRRVNVVGYAVAFDAQYQCFCDIDLDVGSAYVPFIQLALVRLQPASIPGVEMSEVVLCEPTPFLPTRWVDVRRAVGRIEVAVSGASHASPSDPRDAASAPGSRFRATLQSRLPGSVDDAGWRIAPELGEVTVQSPAAGQLWSVAVTFGAVSDDTRLLIEEFESYRTDDLQASGQRVVFAEALPLRGISP